MANMFKTTSAKTVEEYVDAVEESRVTFKRKAGVKLPGKMKPEGKAWHEKNRMPKNATLEQRVAWHREHQKYCGCRPVPKSISMPSRPG